MVQGFEPYVLVSKRLVPWYDERFTGYLEDKVVHIQTMVHMGFTFAVHPSAFVVHYPHPDSHDQALVKTTGLMQEVRKPFSFIFLEAAAYHRLLLMWLASDGWSGAKNEFMWLSCASFSDWLL